ncbi:phosphoadenylyl-sulfate reductase [Methylothermus subterraneus]
MSFDLAHWQGVLANKKPHAILKAALEQFEHVAIAFSGAEDVVLIDMACRLRDQVQVFTLDTGRLHPETYRFIEQVRERYPIELDVLYPDAEEIRDLVRRKGLFSFYRDGHQECCQIRKVNPLRRKLATLDAWISGQRRDQSPDTRKHLAEVELDQTFTGRSGELFKFNPLANWTSIQVFDYIETFKVPFNELHLRGFRSIGCEPCTRPVLPHQPEREGRWWWEESAKKECGIHRKP